MHTSEITIDVATLYEESGTAKLSALPAYEVEALKQAGDGNVVRLTGPGPVWLYLRLAHALHGKARQLIYNSPVTGDVTIFNHDPL